MASTFFAIEDALDPVACDAAIALGESAGLQAAPVYGAGAQGAVDRSARNVDSALIARASADWLFDRLDALFAEAGAALGIAVDPLSEPVQVLRYATGGHFQRWHSDAGMDLGTRRLISVSIELSEPGAYEGGRLEVVPDTVGKPRTMERGGAQFFPSRAIHRVTPVTAGTRWALVAWTGRAEA
jgi:PKHD-type hydroxylase